MVNQLLGTQKTSNIKDNYTSAFVFGFVSLLSLPFIRATFVSEPVSICAAAGEFISFSCATTSSSDLFWRRERSGVTTSVARNDVTLDPAYTVTYYDNDPSEVSSMLVVPNVTADMFEDAYYCEVEGQLSAVADLTEKSCPFCEESEEDFRKKMCTFWKIDGIALPTCDEDLSEGLGEGLTTIELNFGQMSQQIGVQASVFVSEVKIASASQDWNCSVEYSPLTFPERVDLSIGDTLALIFSIDHPDQSAFYAVHVIIRSPNSGNRAGTFAFQFCFLLSALLILVENQI